MANQGKDMTRRSSERQMLGWVAVGQGWMRREVHHSMRLSVSVSLAATKYPRLGA